MKEIPTKRINDLADIAVNFLSGVFRTEVPPRGGFAVETRIAYGAEKGAALNADVGLRILAATPATARVDYARRTSTAGSGEMLLKAWNFGSAFSPEQIDRLVAGEAGSEGGAE